VAESETKEKELNLPPAERQKMSKILSSLTSEQIQYSVKWLADQNHLKRNVELEKHYEIIEKNTNKVKKLTESLDLKTEMIRDDIKENIREEFNSFREELEKNSKNFSSKMDKIDRVEKQAKEARKSIDDLTKANFNLMKSSLYTFRYIGLLLLGILIGYFMNTILYSFSVKIGFAPFWAHFVWIFLLGLFFGIFGKPLFLLLKKHKGY
jgi:DNA repair exonuclease SbcCD ATPase subunit